MAIGQAPFVAPFVPSSFVQGVFGAAPRPRSFAERTLDELTELTPRQLIGLPLTAPLLALGGAVRGVSFGLLDPTDEIVDGLGEFAPPQGVQSALEIAGEIGGSFVPYIGASAVARRAFTGLDLASKLLRGATTFGAPEILRQVLHGEINPQGALRSLATGAAFSLPVSRAVLAPAVFATNLATGGSLLEAGTAAGFAALFGPLEGVTRPKPPAIAGEGKAPTGLLPDIDLSDFVALQKLKAERLRQPEFAQAPVGPFAEAPLDIRGFGLPRTALTRPTPQPPVPGPVAQAVRGALEKFNVAEAPRFTESRRLQFREEVVRIAQEDILRPQRQSELIRAAGATAPSPQGEALNTLASTVDLLAQNSVDELSSALAKTIESNGATSQQAKTVQLALAEAKSAYVPAQAPTQNSLGTVSKGIDIIATDPTSPFVQRAVRERILVDLRASQDPVAVTQAAQLERLWMEAASRRKGGVVTVEDAREFLRRQDEILAQTRVGFRNDEEAFTAFAQEAASHVRPEELTVFEATLPEHYRNRGLAFVERARRHIAEQRRIAARIEAEKLLIDPDQLESGLLAGDHGAALHPLEDGIHLAVGGQDIGRLFRDFGDVRAYLKNLEAGVEIPSNIQQLRLLAHPRGITVDFDGQAVQLINNATGETVTGLTSLEETLALLRRAPRLVDDAIDLTPPALGRNPGPGSIGGVATEAAPGTCSAFTDLLTAIRKV